MIALVVFTFAVVGVLSFTSSVAGFVTSAFREGIEFWRSYRRIDRQAAWDDHVADALRVTTELDAPAVRRVIEHLRTTGA